MTIVSNVKSIIPRFLKNIAHRAVDIFAWDEWSTRSWSQEGEDLVLRRIFDSNRTGFTSTLARTIPNDFRIPTIFTVVAGEV